MSVPLSQFVPLSHRLLCPHVHSLCQHLYFYPANDESIKKTRHIYTMEYSSALKRNGIRLFIEKWRNLESVLQSEVSQKNKYAIWTHICGILGYLGSWLQLCRIHFFKLQCCSSQPHRLPRGSAGVNSCRAAGHCHDLTEGSGGQTGGPQRGESKTVNWHQQGGFLSFLQHLNCACTQLSGFPVTHSGFYPLPSQFCCFEISFPLILIWGSCPQVTTSDSR